MIKAKINSTGEVVEVRPYQNEIYDFMVCRNGGIMGELYMRSELTIIGDNELDFISLVRRMREAQKRVVAYNIFKGVMKYKDLWEEAIIDRTKLEQEVDEYLKKFNENI